jgi:hypothetical protein
MRYRVWFTVEVKDDHPLFAAASAALMKMDEMCTALQRARLLLREDKDVDHIHCLGNLIEHQLQLPGCECGPLNILPEEKDET